MEPTMRAFSRFKYIFPGVLISALYIFPNFGWAQDELQAPIPASAVVAVRPVPASTAIPEKPRGSFERSVALDQTYGLKGWNVPYPSFGETITQDVGGWRTTMAQYGFSFLGYDLVLSASNLLNTPSSNKGSQAYWGQRAPSAQHTDALYLNYDLTQWGIPNGQIQAGAAFSQSTWQQYSPNFVSLYRLAYYQTFLDKTIEFNAGYMSAATAFVANYIAGQIQNPFGPSASIPVEAGLANGVVVQPLAYLKYHIGDFYEQFGAARSLVPKAGAVYQDSLVNPAQARFTVPGSNVLYVNEVGYKTAAASDQMATFIRAGGIYNTSEYHNYSTNGVSNNYGLYLLADRQLLKLGGSSRGVYAGFSVMYAPPDTNLYSKYFEGRAYAIGLFDARPRDTMSFVWGHNSVSNYYANSVNQKSSVTDTFAAYYANSYTLSYNIRVTNGVYLTLGMQYTDHPSVVYIPNEGHSLNLLASSYIAF